jgi:ABC-2 type transport system ATP-binding protein
MNGIRTEHLNARIGTFDLEDITMTVPKGTIMGLLGRNGAGKTTLFKTINGTMLMRSGVLEVDGKTYENDEKAIRNILSVVYDTVNVNPYSTGKRLFNYAKDWFSSFDEAFFDEMVRMFDIDLKKRISALSLGAQKKLVLALALARRPKVLLLDEPLIGIDPIDKRKMTELIQSYMEDEDNTVVISSHQVEDLEKISDAITIIDDGKILLSEDKETLLERYVKVAVGPSDAGTSDLIGGVDSRFGQVGVMRASDAKRHGLEAEKATLEDIFVHLLNKEGN